MQGKKYVKLREYLEIATFDKEYIELRIINYPFNYIRIYQNFHQFPSNKYLKDSIRPKSLTNH